MLFNLIAFCIVVHDKLALSFIFLLTVLWLLEFSFNHKPYLYNLIDSVKYFFTLAILYKFYFNGTINVSRIKGQYKILFNMLVKRSQTIFPLFCNKLLIRSGL
jgi:hypothetical protein